VKLTIQITNNTPFKRMGLDIVYKRNITLKEALCGFTFDLQHLNGKQLCLNNNVNKTIIKPNSKKVIPNMGFNRESVSGNLIIDFEIDFPESLTEEQISQIDNILS
jgi:DnaJ family protein A protein 2